MIKLNEPNHFDFLLSLNCSRFSMSSSNKNTGNPFRHHIPNVPVAPVKRVLISSLLLVRFVSHDRQPYSFVPPMWSRKILPIAAADTKLRSYTHTRTHVAYKSAMVFWSGMVAMMAARMRMCVCVWWSSNGVKTLG